MLRLTLHLGEVAVAELPNFRLSHNCETHTHTHTNDESWRGHIGTVQVLHRDPFTD